ncbi:hypothetical protein B0H15DRAFT_159768 [Mycena belliarum]|uniref:Uncharacterized protein n=1 Tax=Mycena belliarum TaxID=1033014 RepID=A0AAD6TL66_9AGAR|nr:hypothetical protein B0H15DRAFT_159768 [Mycena belliae]
MCHTLACAIRFGFARSWPLRAMHACGPGPQCACALCPATCACARCLKHGLERTGGAERGGQATRRGTGGGRTVTGPAVRREGRGESRTAAQDGGACSRERVRTRRPGCRTDERTQYGPLPTGCKRLGAHAKGGGGAR